MRLLSRLIAYLRIAPRARRNRTELARKLAPQPIVLAAVNAYEMSVLVANRVPPRIKYLAQMKASSMIGCPF